MSHFVCAGECNSVSDQHAVCESGSCSRMGNELTECNCEDGQHAEVKAQAESQDVQD